MKTVIPFDTLRLSDLDKDAVVVEYLQGELVVYRQVYPLGQALKPGDTFALRGFNAIFDPDMAKRR